MRQGKRNTAASTTDNHFEPRRALSSAAMKIATEFEFKGVRNQPGQFQGHPSQATITPDLARDISEIFDAIDAMPAAQSV